MPVRQGHRRAVESARGALASRPFRSTVPQRNLCPVPRCERSGGGAGAGPRCAGRCGAGRRSAGRTRRSPPGPVGAGSPRGGERRTALHPRAAAGLSRPVDPCRGEDARRCAVRAGGRAALPRPGVRDRGNRRQSARARFHRFAPAQPRSRAARSRAVAGAARSAGRPVLGTDALAGGGVSFRPVVSRSFRLPIRHPIRRPALEHAGPRHADLESATVPRARPCARTMDLER